MDSRLEGPLQRAIAKICNIDVERAQLDAKLSDLGVDSLAAAEVLVEVEIQLGKQLPVHVLRGLDRAETVRDVLIALELALDGASAAR